MKLKFYLFALATLLISFCSFANDDLPHRHIEKNGNANPELVPIFINWLNNGEELKNSNEIFRYDPVNKKWTPQAIQIPLKDEIETQNKFTFDPVRFTVRSNKDSVALNEPIEITITAEYLDIHPSLMFQFEGSNEFAIKMLLPEGFVQTDGTYYDFVNGKVTKENPFQTFTIKGYFEKEVDEPCFTLLRSHKGAGSGDSFVRRGNFCFKIKTKQNDNYYKQAKINENQTTLSSCGDDKNSYCENIQISNNFNSDNWDNSWIKIENPEIISDGIYPSSFEGDNICRLFGKSALLGNTYTGLGKSVTVEKDVEYFFEAEIALGNAWGGGRVNFFEFNIGGIISNRQITNNNFEKYCIGPIIFTSNKNITLSIRYIDPGWIFAGESEGLIDNIRFYKRATLPSKPQISSSNLNINLGESITLPTVACATGTVNWKYYDVSSLFGVKNTNGNLTQYPTRLTAYKVECITDNNCSSGLSENSIIVNVRDCSNEFKNPVPTIVTTSSAPCQLNLAVNGYPVSYDYSFDWTKTDGTHSSAANIDISVSGNYSVKLTNEDTGCDWNNSFTIEPSEISNNCGMVATINTTDAVCEPTTLGKIDVVVANNNTTISKDIYLNGVPYASFMSASKSLDLAPGEYRIKVSYADNQTEIIIGPEKLYKIGDNCDNLTPTISDTKANCNKSDGTITVNRFDNRLANNVVITLSKIGGIADPTFPRTSTDYNKTFDGLAIGDYTITVNDITKSQPLLENYPKKIDQTCGAIWCEITSELQPVCNGAKGSFYAQIKNRESNNIVYKLYKNADIFVSQKTSLNSNDRILFDELDAANTYYIKVEDQQASTTNITDKDRATSKSIEMLNNCPVPPTLACNIESTNAGCTATSAGTVKAIINRTGTIAYELYKKTANGDNKETNATSNPIFGNLLAGNEYRIKINIGTEECYTPYVTISSNCPDFSMGIEPTNAGCAGKGSIKVKAIGRGGQNYYYKITNTNGSYGTEVSNQGAEYTFTDLPEGQYFIELKDYQNTLLNPDAPNSPNYKTGSTSIGRECGAISVQAEQDQVPCVGFGKVKAKVYGRSGNSFKYTLLGNPGGTIAFAYGQGPNYTFDGVPIGNYYVEVTDYQSGSAEYANSNPVTVTRNCGAIILSAAEITPVACGNQNTITASIIGRSGNSFQYILTNKDDNTVYIANGKGISYTFKVPAGLYSLRVKDFQNGGVITPGDEARLTRIIEVKSSCPPLVTVVDAEPATCQTLGKITVSIPTIGNETRDGISGFTPKFEYILKSLAGAIIQKSGIIIGINAKTYTFNDISKGSYKLTIIDHRFAITDITTGLILNPSDISIRTIDVNQDPACLSIVANYNTSGPCIEKIKLTLDNGTGPYKIEMEKLNTTTNLYVNHNSTLIANKSVSGPTIVYFPIQLPGTYRFKVVDKYNNFAYSNDMYIAVNVCIAQNDGVFSTIPASCGINASGKIKIKINASTGYYSGGYYNSNNTVTAYTEFDGNPERIFENVPAGTYTAYYRIYVNGNRDNIGLNSAYTTYSKTVIVGTDAPATVATATISNPETCAKTDGTIQVSNHTGELLWYDVPTGGTAIAKGASFTYLKNTADPFTYYVAAKKGECAETARLAIPVVINALPETPRITTVIPANSSNVIRELTSLTLLPYEATYTIPAGNFYQWERSNQAATGPYSTISNLRDYNIANITNAALAQGYYRLTITNAKNCTNSAIYYQPIYPVCNLTATLAENCQTDTRANSTTSRIADLSITFNGADNLPDLYKYYKIDKVSTDAAGAETLTQVANWTLATLNTFTLPNYNDGKYRVSLQEDALLYDVNNGNMQLRDPALSSCLAPVADVTIACTKARKKKARCTTGDCCGIDVATSLDNQVLLKQLMVGDTVWAGDFMVIIENLAPLTGRAKLGFFDDTFVGVSFEGTAEINDEYELIGGGFFKTDYDPNNYTSPLVANDVVAAVKNVTQALANYLAPGNNSITADIEKSKAIAAQIRAEASKELPTTLEEKVDECLANKEKARSDYAIANTAGDVAGKVDAQTRFDAATTCLANTQTEVDQYISRYTDIVKQAILDLDGVYGNMPDPTITTTPIDDATIGTQIGDPVNLDAATWVQNKAALVTRFTTEANDNLKLTFKYYIKANFSGTTVNPDAVKVLVKALVVLKDLNENALPSPQKLGDFIEANMCKTCTNATEPKRTQLIGAATTSITNRIIELFSTKIYKQN